MISTCKNDITKEINIRNMDNNLMQFISVVIKLHNSLNVEK